MQLRDRLSNFFIDSVIFFLICFFTMLLIKDSPGVQNSKYILISVYFFYFMISELFFGKTLGKYFTKTSVISNLNGLKPTTFQIFIRTASRLIPFYFLSYFITGKGLHDHLSKTVLTKTNPN